MCKQSVLLADTPALALHRL